MIALLGSLLGFVSSVIPDIFKLFQDKRDKAHEVELMKLQMEQGKQLAVQKLEEINVKADIAEIQTLTERVNTNTGTWIDALNASVRPIIAYAFFALYASVKVIALYKGLDWQLWTEEDQCIFAGIISFYFGSRALSRARQGK